ncbi:MAG: phosphate/phosphite/phosphonate ABC transporter substrate-binding protein [Nitrospirae bacterium]|nr:phosphate/phosphite/phosphonate ABC transporter substrate-binding protein [Nitrospirota bacterium]
MLPAILLLSLAAYGEDGQKEINIGLVPEINIFNQAKKYKDLESYLTGRTGTKINFKVISQYGNIIDYFYGMKLDGAFFGSLTAVLANSKLEVEPVARPVYINGKSGARGCIIVRKDSGIKGVEDLKGKVMIYVDKASVSGYVFPLAYFKEHGVKNVPAYFKGYSFTGSHDAAVRDVLEKDADAGAVKSTVYEALAKKNPRINNELMIIAESIDLPSDALWLNKNLDRAIRKKIKDALLNMNKDPEGQKYLSEFGAKGFIETTVNDYNGVLTILKEAGIKDLNAFDYYNQ